MADNDLNPNMHPIPKNPGLIRPPPPDHPFFAAMRPEPSWERLQEANSRVTVTNTSDVQMHVVIDRFMVGHELRPGQKVEIEMTNDEIARFQDMRRPDRYYPATDPAKPLRPKPLHPILIEGVGDMIAEAAKRQNAKQAELAQERKEERERNGKGRFTSTV